MRKYIILFIALCLHGLARGQTDSYSSYYWFDSQQGKVQTSPVLQGSFDVDATALADGIHTFHYLVKKDDGVVSLPVYAYFLKATSTAATGQITCLCTIDGELVHHELMPAEGGTIHWNLNVNDIADGLHQVQIDAIAADGAMSGSQHGFFVKVPKADTTIKGYYWFDEETDAREVSVAKGTFEVDASSLSDGFHQFHYYVLQANGVSSLPSANYFLKTAQVNPDDELTCICTVDDELRHIEKLSQQGGVVHWNLDMQDLADGVHKIQLQAVTTSGALSTSYTSYFMRVTSYEDLSEMYCVYAIDGDSFNSKSQVMPQNGSFHFDLDLSELEEGLHYISFMLYSDRGTSTTPQLRFFIKTPLGGNGITQYQYWLNDDDINTATTVTLPEKVNPLKLMSLLPVESRPLRSSLFHFDVSSGKPMIYAKNTIHLRFHDVAQRFTDATKEYVDYSQGQELNIIKTLESGVRETMAKPEENSIKWYEATAERGERLEFKLDRAATLQVFSPSGQEVHNVYGSESVVWNGLNAEESGTFYVALHDVTATQGEVINLDYTHIDRYAVLRQDVDVVGNSGCSTITFEGNGYDELTSVELIQGSYVIPSVEIGHESKATTSVKFDFTNATLGEYKAVFHFLGGEITIEKCVTVEEATPIELDVEAIFGRQYLISFHKTKYVFSIHNSGNVTAYNVPLILRIYTHTAKSLERIDVEGFDLEKDFITALDTFYNDTIASFIKMAKMKSGDRCFFIEADSTDIVAGWAAHVHETFLFPNIPPNSTKEIIVNLQLGEGVYCYIWWPDEWGNNTDVTDNPRLNRQYNKTHTRKNNCVTTGKFWGWLTGANHEERCFRNQQWFNSFNAGNYKFLEEYYDGFVPTNNQTVNPPYPNEYCPDPNIPPMGCYGGGGRQDPGGSRDPNDIFCYLSEAESKFMTDSVAKVTYTIEFENDTTFATAAAHEIFVTDTLDAAKFDLSTFAPSQINIGNRSIELNGEKNFIKTVDMRPEINTIAQVEGTFNEKKGIAKWHISSLDPMTMEPTEDVMQGILPVNHDGTSGIGMVMFNIGLKQPLSDGTEVPNRANIIFDKNEAILTPTWTNIVDAVAPTSIVDGLTLLNDSTLRDIIFERDLLWEDDFDQVAQYVYMMMKELDEENTNEATPCPLVYDKRNEKDRNDYNFARELVATTYANIDNVEPMIRKHLQNWELERVAVMDILLINMAVAEFTSCPSIPERVTVDEYIELSKEFSTEKSKLFINGILDKLLIELRVAGKVVKNERGMYDPAIDGDTPPAE